MTCSRFRCDCIALLFLLASLAPPLHSCPASCVCKWKNGKQTVECVDRGLLIIPEGMDTGTQVLEFSGNNLRTLHKGKFHRMDLIHLQRIYLARCQIAMIENGTFSGLTNLVELDLSGNALEHVPFLDCPALMRLILSSNPIHHIRNPLFGHLLFLQTLELNDCRLSRIDGGVFEGLHSLERLRLGRNALTGIDNASRMPTHLQEVELQGNEWHCDCRIMEMRVWLDSYEMPSNAAPLCARPPRLAKRPVKSIPRPELACLPDVSPAASHLEIGVGQNVSLQCQIRAMPEAHVSWSFHGQMLPNDTTLTPETRLIYYVVNGGAEEKQSELFIYNTHPDDNGTFVCIAENAAGVAQSNFTIRILVTAEPRLSQLAQLPFEFVLIVASATGISLIVICFAILLSLIKCHRERRRPKNARALRNLTKDSLLQDSIEEVSKISKGGSDLNLAHDQQHYYHMGAAEDQLVASMSPSLAAIQLRSVALDQNPDVISDAESMSIGKRHEGDGEAKLVGTIEGTCSPSVCSNMSFPHHPMHTLGYLSPSSPAGNLDAEQQRCDLYPMAADVHLNPAGLLNAVTNVGVDCLRMPNLTNGFCYRTLPYNRNMKRQEARRYHRRDADLTKTSHPQQHRSYDYDQTNRRYTADGYPVRGAGCDSDQETQFSDTESMRSCCSAPTMPWSYQTTPSVRNPVEEKARMSVVATQTQTDIMTITDTSLSSINLCGNGKPSNRSVSGTLKIAETLTESPDEDYEGEEAQGKV